MRNPMLALLLLSVSGPGFAADRLHVDVELSACIVPAEPGAARPAIGAAPDPDCTESFDLVATRFLIQGTSLPDVTITFDAASAGRLNEWMDGRMGDVLILAHDGRVLVTSKILGLLNDRNSLMVIGLVGEDADAMDAILAAAPPAGSPEGVD